MKRISKAKSEINNRSGQHYATTTLLHITRMKINIVPLHAYTIPFGMKNKRKSIEAKIINRRKAKIKSAKISGETRHGEKRNNHQHQQKRHQNNIIKENGMAKAIVALLKWRAIEAEIMHCHSPLKEKQRLTPTPSAICCGNDVTIRRNESDGAEKEKRRENLPR